MKKIIPLGVLAMLWHIFPNDLCNVAHARGAAGPSVAPVSSGTPLQDTTRTIRDTLAIDEVEINTGYQRIPKERTTGSFVFVDSALLNRTFSTDVLSRLEGVVSGLRFNRIPDQPDNIDMTLRGPSTIRAANQPLIILDNFEYQGDITNINPNDIANITVLRDAAAASIWGAKAGNGVLVITTKSGRVGHTPTLALTANSSFTPIPNLYAAPQLSSTDAIDLQQDLFGRGYYTATLRSVNKTAIPPAVWLMHQHDLGELSDNDFAAQLDALRAMDIRNDMARYLYQPRLKQQYALSLNGGNAINRYYASVGWDHDRQQLVRDDARRLTVNLNNRTALFQDRLQINVGMLYTNKKENNNGLLPIVGLNYPYARLADDKGLALPILQYNPGFLETVGDGRLLDWYYRPLDELALNDNGMQLDDLKLNTEVSYRIAPWLQLKTLYQFNSGRTLGRRHYREESYFARDLINQFSYFGAAGDVTRPIPLGGILNLNNRTYAGHQGRFQATIAHAWGEHHRLDAVAGSEINQLLTQSHENRYYGYMDYQPGGVNVDAVNTYRSMVTGRQNLRIGTPQTIRHLTDRFVSFYGNAGYTYRDRYHLSLSARRDGSNLFGVNTNQQWNPLWSAGMKWDVHKEGFFHLSWLPALSARFTYGASGNIDRSVAAHLTGALLGANEYGLPMKAITEPTQPQPDLGNREHAQCRV